MVILPRVFAFFRLLMSVCLLAAWAETKSFGITYKFASVNAFSNVQFNVPIAITTPPGETNRITNNVFSFSGTNTNKATISFSKTTGLFKGTFVFPETTNRTAFKGAILRNNNSGGGAFTGSTEGGTVSLTGD